MGDERLTRREYLTRGAGAVLAAGAAAAAGYLLYDPQGQAGLPKAPPAAARLRNYFAPVDWPASNPRVSIASGSAQRIGQMVRAAVHGLDPRLGMRRFVGGADTVLIKPNVGFDRPAYLGATTHPQIVGALVRLCRQAGARRVVVCDNPVESAAGCFRRSGIQRAAEEAGARLELPAQRRFGLAAFRQGVPDRRRGEVLGRWPVLNAPLAEATRLIGVAPVKDHNLAGASMVLKNWYGLLGGRRNRLHQAIHEAISDLALAFSPTLVIADATRVMMRNGPTGGRLSDLRPGGRLGRPAVVAAVDPLACDAWCYQELLGRDPMRLRYLELAQQKIRAAIAGGARRFGQRDWRAYERAGLITRTSVS